MVILRIGSSLCVHVKDFVWISRRRTGTAGRRRQTESPKGCSINMSPGRGVNPNGAPYACMKIRTLLLLQLDTLVQAFPGPIYPLILPLSLLL